MILSGFSPWHAMHFAAKIDIVGAVYDAGCYDIVTVELIRPDRRADNLRLLRHGIETVWIIRIGYNQRRIFWSTD